MSASSPRISVIVVCKNPGARLRSALESVWTQREADTELIVIDGASTDGTCEWLDSQRHRIATCVSEPDTGVYDAMNKGIAAARGTWLFFLGADDRLASPAVFADITAALCSTDDGIVVGEARFEDGRRYVCAGSASAIRRNFIHHQAAFYRRTLFNRFGHFDCSLRIQADYDLNLRLLLAGVRIVPLDQHIATCAAGGLSDSGHWANYREEITIRHRHFSAWRCWPWDLIAIVRWLRKKIV